MTIRLLEQSDNKEAKQLWKDTFGDSDAFINWYFENKILPGNSLGLFDGNLISVVHMVPYKICIQGKPLDSLMVAGVATAGHRRGEGLMRQLLHAALVLMKERGVMVTHLYPVSHGFYEKFGWTTYTYVHKNHVEDAVVRPGSHVTETADAGILDSLYRKMMQSYDGYVMRGPREWKWRLEELFADGGKAAVLTRASEAAAYLLYYEKEGKADVIETVYTHERDIGDLVAHLLEKGMTAADYHTPAHGPASAEKHAMVRVVDVKALLTAFGAERVLSRMDISDDFAEWNNVCGSQRRMAIPIRSLAEIVHNGACGESREFDPRNCPNIGLKEIFLRQSSCIFEAY